jgi:hypothetical protein
LKFKTIIISLIIYIALAALLPLINQYEATYKFLPGTTDGFQLFFLMLLLIIPSTIFSLIFGYLLPPVYLFLHKNIIGRRMNYGIQEKKESKKFRKAYRGVFAGLMAMNLSLLLAPFLTKYVIKATILSERSDTNLFFMSFIFGLLLTLGPSVGLFASAWFLNDSGISYTNIEQANEKNDIIEIRAVGNWYTYALKGYAGVGVIISYISILLRFLASNDELFNMIFNGILTFSLPFLLAASIMPSLLILEYLKEHRKKYVRSLAKKLGIINNLEVNIVVQ